MVSTVRNSINLILTATISNIVIRRAAKKLLNIVLRR
jgi:hypothetical protein